MADRYLLESGAPDGYLLEDGSGVLLLEGFTPAADTDDWWSGSAMNFVAVAVVGAATLLSSNTAIARTFVQQDDLPVVAATPAGYSAESPPTQRARISPVFNQWYANDELPLAAAPAVIDVEPAWSPPVPTAAVRAFGVNPEWDDQALSWTIDEQYSWSATWVQPAVVRIDGFGDQDFLPVQAPVFGGEEEAVPVAQPAPAVKAFLGDSPAWADDALSWYIDEQYEWKPFWIPPQTASHTFFDSDALPIALDEEPWAKPVVSLPALQGLLQFDDTDAVFATAPTIVDDEPWTLFGTRADVRPVLTLWSVDDERVPVAAFSPSEDEVQASVFTAPNPNVVVWATDEEIVPQAAAPSIGGGVLRERVNVHRWAGTDDWIQFVAPAPAFEDDAWSVFTPAPQAANRNVWSVDDTWTVPAAFTPNDEDAPPAIFVAANPNVIIWATDEEIIPQPGPPSIGGGVLRERVNVLRWAGADEWVQFVAPSPAFEDDSWQVYTPALQLPNRTVWGQEEDTVPQPTFGLDEFEQPVFVPAIVKAIAPIWFGDDERVPFVAPTPAFEDESWVILQPVPIDRAPYSAMLFQGSTEDGSTVVIEPPPPPTGTHTWLLVKRRTRR